MDDLMMKLGTHIRVLRRGQGRSLREISGVCGFTESLLSKIETNRVLPPVATLTRIARALGVEVSALLDADMRPQTVHTAAGAAPRTLVATTKGYQFRMLASGRAGKLMEPYLFVARRGRITPGPLQHRGEEFLYVLQGRMKYRVGDLEYRLGPGDSLYFNSAEEHDMTPLSAKVVYLGIFADPPALVEPHRKGLKNADSDRAPQE
jgi:transcriptional regulator with XRE-family HTH domain